MDGTIRRGNDVEASDILAAIMREMEDVIGLLERPYLRSGQGLPCAMTDAEQTESARVFDAA